MKPGYGAGLAVAVLLSLVAFLLGLVGYAGLLALVLLLSGGWTVLAALALVAPSERVYYSSWGLVLAVLSSSYFIQLRYALALVLLAVVAMIVVSVYSRKRTPPAAAP